jgi:hypothetical protein
VRRSRVHSASVIKTGKLVVNLDLTESAHCSRSLDASADRHKESSKDVDS